MCSGWHHFLTLSLDLPHLSGACLPSLADLPEQLHATVFRLREVEKQCMSIPTTIQRLMGPERHLNVTRFKLMISGKCYVNNLTCHVYLYYMKLSCMPLISYLTHIIRRPLQASSVCDLRHYPPVQTSLFLCCNRFLQQFKNCTRPAWALA